MITQDLFDSIHSALTDRADWEGRQRDWYRLRYEGYGREKLPYPGAPDMHYPLVDIEIEKLKPFYIQQIYGQERLASFIDLEVGQSITPSATNAEVADDELRFDSEVRQQSNFDQAAHVFTDKMLHYGICVVKKLWDSELNQLVYVPIDAARIIVPPKSASLQSAEWLVHVIRLSESSYRANKKYKQDEDLIKRIKGSGQPGTDDQRQQEIDIREGITGTKYEDSIILWEVYFKNDPKDKSWTISTVSPLTGIKSDISADHGLPYDQGVFPKEKPFAVFSYEAATEGFYSPRGLAEILEPFELALCKDWNYMLQFLDFNGQPTYFVNSPLANMLPFTNEPGSVRPFGIERDAALNAPIDLKEQMQLTRALAEDRVSIPDLGAATHLTGKEGQKGQVTATQIKAVVGLTAQSNDLRARIFKGQLAASFRQDWDIICQYRNIVPHKASIVPCGNADQWNKEARAQKMIAMFQLLQGRPNVDQDELLKMLLEQDEPETVRRLWRDTGMATADQAEKQAIEFGTMVNGFTPQAKADDDDYTHLTTLAQMSVARGQNGETISPQLAQSILAHGAQHEQQMKAKKDPRLPEISQTLQPVIEILAQIAQSGAQAADAQGNALSPSGPPMAAPGGPPDAGPVAPAAPAPAAPGVSINIPAVQLDPESARAVFAEMAASIPPPNIVVQMPEQRPPDVHVAAPVVNVQPTPVLVKPPPQPAAPVNIDIPTESDIKVIYDKDGKVVGAKVKRK